MAANEVLVCLVGIELGVADHDALQQRAAVGVGVLKQVNIGRRHRAYEAPAIIAAFTDLER
jgi:hypothetical protein